MLANLYGLLGRIDKKKCENFLQTATGWGPELGDQVPSTGGGAEKKGVGSVTSVYALHEAILSYQHLELPIPEVGNATHFLLSLWDESAALFGGIRGAPGSLRASATVLQVLDPQP
jgi:hypothetical protein